MKAKILEDLSFNPIYITLAPEVLQQLGWSTGDVVHLDIPLTGGGLRIFKDSDPIVHMGGVKEVIRG